MLVTRLIYKRTVKEANDAETIAVQTWKSWQAHNIRISVISTICAHMVFASVGASKVIDHIREAGSSWKFGQRTLEEVDAVLSPLETKDRCKLSDLSVTLTGRAFISRLLDKSWGSVKDRLKKCNDAVDLLVSIGVYTKKELDFTSVLEICESIPLYGKTRAVNLVRAFSVSRQLIGLSRLTVDFTAFKRILAMHQNVTKACELQDVDTSDMFDALTHCVVHTSLIKMSYGNPNNKSLAEALDVGDLALCFCEYSCALQTVRNRQGIIGSDIKVAQWIVERLPNETSGLQHLRRAVCKHVDRNPNTSNGWDGSRCRDVLEWWMTSSLCTPQNHNFDWSPRTAEKTNVFCEFCGDLLYDEFSISDCSIGRYRKYCSDECKGLTAFEKRMQNKRMKTSH